MVVENNKEDKQIKSVGYGGMLVAGLLRMQMGFKSHPVVIALTFKTCPNLLQLLIVCQMN